MREIKLKARAKINLGLDVVRKREDGYHEVRMIMQMINLYDRITLKEYRAWNPCYYESSLSPGERGQSGVPCSEAAYGGI